MGHDYGREEQTRPQAGITEHQMLAASAHRSTDHVVFFLSCSFPAARHGDAGNDVQTACRGRQPTAVLGSRATLGGLEGGRRARLREFRASPQRPGPRPNRSRRASRLNAHRSSFGGRRWRRCGAVVDGAGGRLRMVRRIGQPGDAPETPDSYALQASPSRWQPTCMLFLITSTCCAA